MPEAAPYVWGALRRIEARIGELLKTGVRGKHDTRDEILLPVRSGRRS